MQEDYQPSQLPRANSRRPSGGAKRTRAERAGEVDLSVGEVGARLIDDVGRLCGPRDLAPTVADSQMDLLHSLFLRQVADRYDELAVITPTCQMTYGELHRRAVRIATWLRDGGVESNTLVAVLMYKGWEQIVAALGILYSGAAYLPVDPQLPAERRQHLFRNGKVQLVLTQTAVARQVDWPENRPRLCVDQAGEWTGLFALPVQHSDDLAYVIYTSGSTGQPKGVMINHRGAVNTIRDMNRRFAVTPADRVLAVSSLCFDLSVYDVFGILAAGGTVVMPAANLANDVAHWVELVVRERVTIWNSVPALMQLFCERAAGLPGSAENRLRLVLLSGDWVPLKLPDQIRTLAPAAEIISLGGATEASIWSVLFPITTVDSTWKSIPYGRAMENQTIYVLNDALEPCLPPALGQLYIGGIGLAVGYWSDPVKTAERFVEHPRTGERLYRTGDLGRWLPDGNIEFCGREDLQVKIKGYRIELEEIEAALQQHPELSAAVVTVKGTRHGSKSLVAHVVPRERPPTPQSLREFLLTKLPAYTVPAVFHVVQQLPLTPNGKVDRQALAILADQSAASARSVVLPRTELEETLTEIWKEVFEIGQVGIEDCFLELGGDSLKAIQIISRIRLRLGIEVPVRDLFENPTVAQLAHQLEAKLSPPCLEARHPDRRVEVPA